MLAGQMERPILIGLCSVEGLRLRFTGPLLDSCSSHFLSAEIMYEREGLKFCPKAELETAVARPTFHPAARKIYSIREYVRMLSVYGR